ncbi:MAG: SIS domain-containing protein [Anaerolineales bacterium]|nr:SIS domain-containing protein [Anaerolineales bacterium]MDW8162784.1 SIS domain-containing protein [Anaerolineales bacterium]
MEKSIIAQYFARVYESLQQAEQSQSENVYKAAQLTAQRLIAGNILHVFGTGHSHILAEEIFFRAGGLVQVNAILDPALMLHLSASKSTDLERLQNYARIVLERYDLQEGDVLLVVSNSGRNAVPIEAALYGKEHGLHVIAMTSAAAYAALPSRHPSGKKLADVADIVIDTCVPEGDASLSLPGLEQRFGPLSTILGATLIQALVCATIEEMLRHQVQPKVLISANVDSGQDHAALFQEYRRRIRHF